MLSHSNGFAISSTCIQSKENNMMIGPFQNAPTRSATANDLKDSDYTDEPDSYYVVLVYGLEWLVQSIDLEFHPLSLG